MTPPDVVFARKFITSASFVGSSRFIHHKIAKMFYFLAVLKANVSCLQYEYKPQGGLTHFSLRRSKTISTTELPFMERLAYLRPSALNVIRLLSHAFKKFFLRLHFRSKPKHALHQPLHGEKRNSQYFHVQIIEQKKSFQKILKSGVYDKTQQSYDFFSIFLKPQRRF